MKIEKRKRVSILRKENFFPSFFIFVKLKVRRKRRKREKIMRGRLRVVFVEDPKRMTVKIRTKISSKLSRVPIPIILCPSLVLTILNSSKIGIRIASPTVAKDNAIRKEISKEYLNTKCTTKIPKNVSNKTIKKVALKINLLFFLISFKSISKPIIKRRKYIPS